MGHFGLFLKTIPPNACNYLKKSLEYTLNLNNLPIPPSLPLALPSNGYKSEHPWSAVKLLYYLDKC